VRAFRLRRSLPAGSLERANRRIAFGGGHEQVDVVERTLVERVVIAVDDVHTLERDGPDAACQEDVERLLEAGQ
jgi:hypothetical protein